MAIIEIDNISYKYPNSVDDTIKSLSIKIEEGSFVALVGHNGSGKSTLARMLNGLITADKGSVKVCDMLTTDSKKLFEIRKNCGLVFQNPDNQAVASIVEDDVAFGPENIGIDFKEIRQRVDWALDIVGMKEYSKSMIHKLSGGQKQRVAIAGVLALKPKIIVLDESTSMLDPKGRKEVLEVVKNLVVENKITVVMITHYMTEAMLADRIVVMDKGSILFDGGKEILQKVDELRRIGLDVPICTSIAHGIRKHGVNFGDVLNIKDLIFECNKYVENSSKDSIINLKENYSSEKVDNFEQNNDYIENRKQIVFCKDLNYVYSKKTPFEKKALDGVSMQIFEGDFVGIAGHTGSGKSTFVTHLNGLNKLQNGELVVCDIKLNKKYNYKELRSSVGFVFQYPEYQLFDETVIKDVSFGPKKLDWDADKIYSNVKDAISRVGLDYDALGDKSPFELSGGQKRRVAIAGVIAMRPKVLVLDEPTAGLDPKGKQEIFDLIHAIKDFCPTIIIVSHNMDELAKYCNKVAVFDHGNLKMFDSPKVVFEKSEELKDIGLDIPDSVSVCNELKNNGFDIGVKFDEKDIAFELLNCLVSKVKGGMYA